MKMCSSFTCVTESSTRARALRQAGVEVIRLPARTAIPKAAGFLRPDLQAVLAELGRRNILSVLLEAGETLNEAALGAGLVDKVRLFYAPILAGNRLETHSETKSAARRASPASKTRRGATPHPHELSNVHIEHFGPDFAVEGYLRDIYQK